MNFFNRCKTAAQSASKYVLGVVGVTVVSTAAVAPAMATTSQIATDTIALIQSYGADAVLVVSAMILAFWGLRALGLFGRK